MTFAVDLVRFHAKIAIILKLCTKRDLLMLFTEFNSLPNLITDKGIYSTWAGSILTSAGPAWDLRVQLMEHEGEYQ